MGGVAISIIKLLIRSESETAERMKRYILSGVIGMLAGVFFMSATWLLIYCASLLMNYVI